MLRQQEMATMSPATARILDHARNGTADYATRYLRLDAGQGRSFLRKIETISERVLLGWLFVVAACCCWAMSTMITGGTRPEQATLQMERLADKLESTSATPTATATAVARILAQPWYDCRHVTCSPELADRNGAARRRLRQLLASRGPANGLDLDARRPPQQAGS
jgi:hypothetical protein